ncbi:MAG: ATP phosphoribosyltransferase regulatory subunit [Leptolyngbyaceae bacterium]|nr:ATP phosphoribosyltransferase regulatory subunit [Leptolyngbyaceae bacterium]
MMAYQPPTGSRDLFPVDVAQKQWIEERLQTIFQRWGYHRIITSTLERLDTLMAGGAIDRSTVIHLQDADNEMLGLRPELTASIARAAAMWMSDASLPQRFYYTTNVFRRPTKRNHERQHEFYQAGVELLGSGGLVTDAEVVMLVVDCLRALKLEQCHLILGEAGLTRSLLSTFPDQWRDRIRLAIAQLDRITLETLPLAPDLRDRALWLLDLRGKPADVLQKLSAIDLDETQQTIVTNLKSLVDLLEGYVALQPGAAIQSIVLDLSLVQTFDYYTGVVFDVITSTPQGQRTLGRGGRYDHLLGLYLPDDVDYPGIGFSLSIEELHQALLPIGHLPKAPPMSDWLVVPETPQALSAVFAYAHELRNTNPSLQIELYPEDVVTPEQVRHYAAHRSIRAIAWVQSEGQVTTELIGDE